MQKEVRLFVVRRTHPAIYNQCFACLMSNYRRADIKGGAYFFTVMTYRRRHNPHQQKELQP